MLCKMSTFCLSSVSVWVIIYLVKAIHEVNPQNPFKGAKSSFGVVCKAIQGNIGPTGTEKWQFFSSTFVMAKN